jgi:hypothetical protein
VRSQKPELRITKWLRRVRTPGPRIPFEAECTACADAQFKIRYDKRSEWGDFGTFPPFGPPELERYTNVLQRQFEEHLKLVHPDEKPAGERESQSGQ